MKQKVLITGANGFLAKHLKEYLSPYFDLICLNHKQLDLLDMKAINDFFNNNKIDVVVHTAISGNGSVSDTSRDYMNNINMYENLLYKRSKFDYFINFGSGAEFDRETNIINAEEKSINYKFPKDLYGLAKNMISRSVIRNKIGANLRLFGCFGKYEKESRFFKQIFNNKKIHITNDRYFDYMSVENVCKFVHYCIDERIKDDINMVHEQKYKLSELAKIAETAMDEKIEIIVDNIPGLWYTGNASELNVYNFLQFDEIGTALCMYYWGLNH